MQAHHVVSGKKRVLADHGACSHHWARVLRLHQLLRPLQAHDAVELLQLLARIPMEHLVPWRLRQLPRHRFTDYHSSRALVTWGPSYSLALSQAMPGVWHLKRLLHFLTILTETFLYCNDENDVKRSPIFNVYSAQWLLMYHRSLVEWEGWLRAMACRHCDSNVESSWVVQRFCLCLVCWATEDLIEGVLKLQRTA